MLTVFRRMPWWHSKETVSLAGAGRFVRDQLQNGGTLLSVIFLVGFSIGRRFQHRSLIANRTLQVEHAAERFLPAARAELAKASHELQILERAKREFLSVIGHELRTPLNLITGYASMLADGVFGELTAEQREALEQVIDGGDRLLALINDLLDMTRLDAKTISLSDEELDYAALVRDLLYEVQCQAQARGISIETAIPPDLPLVHGDRQRVAQVLENLLSNAIKFSRAGDRIRITVRLVACELITEISDTGPGIPAAALPKLFTRFYQVDMSASRAYGGTGLGLAIVKGLVEAMGGKVGVISLEGQGSTFWFTLPVTRNVIAAAI
ncbi:MAG: HAMP domain-containing histidine kinase [Cyanobacteria bacterium NC_groundwater_1444_Ag_S-0.65um_54_12]|nr:HAMP domain-containing histidine kinase [Cyanobacteria bacterium NC_groundwater_1444_Ag_S-0.65um_54_12]